MITYAKPLMSLNKASYEKNIASEATMLQGDLVDQSLYFFVAGDAVSIFTMENRTCLSEIQSTYPWVTWIPDPTYS